MKKLNVYSLALSFGITFTIFYLFCMILMAYFNENISIFVFKSLFHGLDVRSIIRTNVPISLAIIGLFESFVIGGIMGALVSSLYNCFERNKV